MFRRRGAAAGIGTLAAALAAMLAFSARLSATRVYQVDECYNVAMARLLGQRREAQFQTDPAVLPLALSGLARRAARSRDLFADGRLAMLGIFWLNLFLLAACTGERLASRRGLVALLAAGSLAPLWDYGFEIRHDNLLLTGLLLTWYALRVRPGGWRAYFAAGALAAGLQFVAFKAFVYTAPLSAAFLAFPPPGHRSPRRVLRASWAAGAAAALAAARWGYGALGLWPLYAADLRAMSAAAASFRRVPPFAALGRFVLEAPILFALLCAALTLVVRDLARRGPAARSWDEGLPEAALFAGAFAALLVNPIPYTYNLLILVPFAFLAVYRQAGRLADLGRARLGAFGLDWTSVLLLHAAFFGAAVCWEAAWSNARQVELMDLAEALTAPAGDPVLDGAGLVPTRPGVDFHWLLDTLNVRRYRDGSGPPLRDVLARNPAAVIIPNYRTDWLAAEDRDFIRRRYVGLADDFYVLGGVLAKGGGDLEVLHAGRYWLMSDCAGDVNLSLDGTRLSAGAARLSAGRHRLRAGAACRAAAVWLGPSLERPPLLAQSGHRRLFVDWY